MITIAKTGCNYEPERLRSPMAFKGSAVTEIWQVAVRLAEAGGGGRVGLGVQSVLWSDAEVFSRFSETDANSLMFQLTAHALRLCESRTFPDPPALLDSILPEVMAHGRTITGSAALRPTFALNSLVAVDNAAWLLYAERRGTGSFDDLIQPVERAALGHCNRLVAKIPLVGYGTSLGEAASLAREGYSVVKIRIGNDPDRDGDRAKMLAWDCQRMTELHSVLRDCAAAGTSHGRVAYYLDANGRYDSIDRVNRLLDHCGRIGALERILLLEEPFPEESETDVRGLPVRIAADESAHSVADVMARIDQGYGAITLKPAAKTLSLSLRMAAVAHGRGTPCYCADLTVNPVLVDWNKNVAARLAPLPGLSTGLLESNGPQMYADWERMKSYLPNPAAPWVEPHGGAFELNDEFFRTAGGIMKASEHYSSMVTT